MTTEEDDRLSGRDAWIVVGALTLLALGLRLLNFGDSLSWDEGSTRFVVHGRSFLDMLDYVKGEQEVTPPLYFVFAWFAQRFGDSPELYRLPALLAGLATVPLTFLLGRMTVGAKAGLVGSALIALSPFMIFYSTEARGYSLLALCVVISSIALVKALRGNRPVWWGVFAVASAAAMYSHYTALFALVGQFAWALVCFPERRRRLLLAGIGAAVLFLPWLPEYLADSDSPGAKVIGELGSFDFSSVMTGLARWSFGHPIAEIGSIPGPFFTALLVIGLLIGGIGLTLRISRDQDWKPDKILLLPIILALSTPLGTILFSSFSVNVFQARNLAPSSVGLALLVGALVTAPRSAAMRWSATGLVLACFLGSAVKIQDPDNRRPDFTAAAEYIGEHAKPGSVVVDTGGLQPAPTSNMDIAFEQEGISPKIIRLGTPEREDQTAAIAPGGAGRYAPLPVASTDEVAAQALELAGGAPVFLVSGASEIYGPGSTSPLVTDFERAMQGRATETSERYFPGLAFRPTVRVFDAVKTPGE